MRTQCPCCGYLTIEHPNSYEICPVCFWEDDGVYDSDEYSVINDMTLGEAQGNYDEFGACVEDMIENCRQPLPEEIFSE